MPGSLFVGPTSPMAGSSSSFAALLSPAVSPPSMPSMPTSLASNKSRTQRRSTFDSRSAGAISGATVPTAAALEALTVRGRPAPQSHANHLARAMVQWAKTKHATMAAANIEHHSHNPLTFSPSSSARKPRIQTVDSDDSVDEDVAEIVIEREHEPRTIDAQESQQPIARQRDRSRYATWNHTDSGSSTGTVSPVDLSTVKQPHVHAPLLSHSQPSAGAPVTAHPAVAESPFMAHFGPITVALTDMASAGSAGLAERTCSGHAPFLSLRQATNEQQQQQQPQQFQHQHQRRQFDSDRPIERARASASFSAVSVEHRHERAGTVPRLTSNASEYESAQVARFAVSGATSDVPRVGRCSSLPPVSPPSSGEPSPTAAAVAAAELTHARTSVARRPSMPSPFPQRSSIFGGSSWARSSVDRFGQRAKRVDPADDVNAWGFENEPQEEQQQIIASSPPQSHSQSAKDSKPWNFGSVKTETVLPRTKNTVVEVDPASWKQRESRREPVPVIAPIKSPEPVKRRTKRHSDCEPRPRPFGHWSQPGLNEVPVNPFPGKKFVVDECQEVECQDPWCFRHRYNRQVDESKDISDDDCDECSDDDEDVEDFVPCNSSPVIRGSSVTVVANAFRTSPAYMKIKYPHLAGEGEAELVPSKEKNVGML